MRSGFHIAVVLCLFVAGSVRAEDIRVTARVDSSNVLIGDWVVLKVDVQRRSGVMVDAPALPDSLPGFALVRRDTGTEKREGDNLLRSYTFTLAAFDSGTQMIPPVVVRYHNEGDTAGFVAQSAAIPVFVRGIAVDSTAELKDVKPPISVPLSWRDLLPYFIALVVLAGLIRLFFYIRKKRARGESIIPTAPPRPAYELALEALRALESEHLWQRGKLKEYHSAVTDIVRTYIERDFSVIAMEMTSEEILASMPLQTLSKEDRALLRELLVRADLVKFAKYQPSGQENESAMSSAVSFVEHTRAHPAEGLAPAPARTVAT